MQIARSSVESCLADLPDMIDPEDVMYRLYMLQKIEAGEQDIREGHILAHEAVIERLARKWQS